MIPSNKWFPSSLQERAAWFNNFKTKFDLVAVDLGFLPADITAVNADNAVVQEIAEIATELDAYAAAVRQYRSIITEGDIGTPTPAFPDTTSFNILVPVATGIFERLDNLVKRIRVAPAYTNEIGALLGILPSTGGPAPEAEMQPTLKMLSLPGSVVQVKFVRGTTDGVVVETKIDNADTWSEAGRYFKSPAELVIPANPQNLPRSVQVRARFVEGNTPVGQFSDIVTTATQPAG